MLRTEYNSLKEKLLIFFIIVLPLNRILSVNLGFVSLSLSEISIFVGFTLLLLDNKMSEIVFKKYSKYIILMSIFLIACLVSFINISDFLIGFRYIFSAIIKFMEFLFVICVLYASPNKSKFLKIFIYLMTFSAIIGLFQIGYTKGNYEGNITGTFNFRNEFIFYILPAALLSLHFYLSEKSKKFLIFFFVIFLTILLSRGRTGLFVLIFCSLLMIISWYKTKVGNIFLILIGVFIMFYTVFNFLPSSITRELEYRYLEAYTLEQKGKTGSSVVREIVIRNGFGKFLESPIYGYGAGDFFSLSSNFNELKKFGLSHLQPHNSFLGLLVEVGLLGIIPILLIILFSILNNKRLSPLDKKKYTHFQIIIFGTLVNLFLFDGMFRELLWFLLPFGLYYPNILKYKS